MNEQLNPISLGAIVSKNKGLVLACTAAGGLAVPPPRATW
jgi:hypothetical protein